MGQTLLVDIHIPKTAGTALLKVLAREYGDGIRDMGNAFRKPDQVEALVREVGEAPEGSRPPAIAGHMVFGLRDLLPPDARYLTVLREPIDRDLSQYGYLVAPREVMVAKTRRKLKHAAKRGDRSVRAEPPRRHGLLAPDTPYRPDLSLEECLDDPRYLPDNLQTRMLVCSRSPYEELPADALDQARAHLRDRFTFVGLTERFDDSLAVLTALFGWRARFAPRARVNSRRPRVADLSPSIRRALEEHNALDLELYAFGSELFGQAVERVGPEAALQIDVLRRANELRDGAEAAELPAGDLRGRLVEAQAGLLVQEVEIERLQRKVAKRRATSQRAAQSQGAPVRAALHRLGAAFGSR